MEAIGTLAGGIAHDFNNLLMTIEGNVSLLLFELDVAHPNYKILRKIENSVKSGAELTRQLLTFSRQTEQKRAPLEIPMIVNEALNLLKSTLPSTIELQKHIGSSLKTVLADPSQIHQVLMNLCTNAYHSMLDQGGTLEIILQPEDLSPGVQAQHLDLQPGPYTKLTISDTGCGMDNATLNKIFDPYFTTKEADKGTGLGLSVVHGIVESHGGVISVNSVPGQGTRFEVLFPQMAIDKKANEDEVESIPTGSERILLVDDEDAVVETGKSILEKLGYQVKSHTDQKPDDFDLVITDMTMPAMTGDVLATKIISIRPDIPVIVCTGYSERIDKEIIKKIGVKELAMKTLEMKDLAEMIRRVLGGKLERPGKTLKLI